MKLKKLKEILNSFPCDMDETEVILDSGGDCDLQEDLDIYTATVIRITNKDGTLFKFSHKEGEWWYVCGKKVTYQDEGMTETKELAIIIS